ncbi:AAA family ATPase [Amycolatopsis sp. Hca4]|uniref:AAA family ATPase n=1 Tax=Amycolatopsis sp. Hca4 TaxID=2742131 RepID=UPI001592323C|nr:LuxR family transcriptional regulator [Amycolatopsis sp. Hca4]QKV74013.1 helix-turn-helix domain-containing protein [Amycolatopsis sp. Hca4]
MEHVLDAVVAAETPLVLLTGFAGTGRTTLLARLGERREADGRHVSALRFTSAGDVVPAHFAVLPDGRGASSAARLRGPVRGEPAWATIGPADGAADDPAVALRAARAAAAALRRTGEDTVLLLDDLQWIDRNSLAVLEALVRLPSGQSPTCVGALRVPLTGAAARYGAEVLARLRAEHLVTTLRLPPLTGPALAGRLHETLRAAPDAALADHVRAVSRGVPAAVSDALEDLRRREAIRVVDRTARLVPAAVAGEPEPAGEYVRVVRELGPEAWEAAKAMALLCPLGPAAPPLAAQALGTSREELLRRLEVLRAAGVVHRGRVAWRFPVPWLATALAASCGPYERRLLAAAAVEALWSGDATCADAGYRAHLLADAGPLVDPGRAAAELVRHATEAPEAGAAPRWLTAAAGLAGDRVQRAGVLLALAAVHDRHGRYEESLRITRLASGEGADGFEAGSLLVRGLSGTGDVTTLRAIADGDEELPGGLTASTALRALACALLDRWPEAEKLAEAAGPAERAPASSGGTLRVPEPWAVATHLIRTLGALWQGRAEPFERSLLDRDRWPAAEPDRTRQREAHLTGLLVNGELHRAEQLLAAEHASWSDTDVANRTMAAVLHGNFRDAAELACRSVARRSAPGSAASTAGMVHGAVSALVRQARLTTARELLTATTRPPSVLAHLPAFAEAQLDRALGDARGAAGRLTAALAAAAERGLVAGCDAAYAELADLALDAGDRKTAHRCLVAAERLARALPTGRATLSARFVRAVVVRDPAAATGCLELARDRGQPFELPVVLARLVKHGVAEPALLSEAYELMGGTGDLLHRAKTRTLMREHGVVVPGRRNTVAENERLLATLAAEGLSNKQIAAALRTSEKSVEGRLSRLFTRSGYRSRIELSAAIANGELAF